MNIGALPGAAPQAAPAPAPSASAEGGDGQPFARLLHAAAAPKPKAATEQRPAAPADGKARPKGTEEAETDPRAAELARALKRAPAEAEDTRAAAEPSAEDTGRPAAGEDDTPADAASLLASLLGATPRPATAKGAPEAGGAGEAATLPDAGAAHGVLPARFGARDGARDGAREAAAGGDALTQPLGRAGAEQDSAAARTGQNDAPAFTLPTLPASLQPGATPPPAADAATTGADPRIAAPVHSPEFAPALGAQVSLLVREGVQEARLQLNPAELGPITVQIQLDGQSAQVVMAAEQADTRQRLEQALPALAGALQDSGLTLTGGGVFEQPRQQAQPQGQAPSGQPARWQAGGPDPDDETATVTAPLRRQVAAGGLDLYA